jgi:hypothetical protein
LRVPGDYRAAYQSLGSWAVAADQGQGAKEIQFVYASPGTIAAYRENGHFADGSVLVKEVFEATTGAMNGSMPPTLRKPRRPITRRIVSPAISRRERLIGFMSVDTRRLGDSAEGCRSGARA